MRDIIPTYPQQGHLWEELARCMKQQNIFSSGTCLTIYYSDEPEIDAEVCEPLDKAVAPYGRMQVHELPAVATMASVVHHGPFTTISEAYQAILKWIEANGYRCVGPVRELYLQATADGSQTDPNTVTEIQFPVEKV